HHHAVDFQHDIGGGVMHLDLALSGVAVEKIAEGAVGGIGLYHLDQVVHGPPDLTPHVYHDPVEVSAVQKIPQGKLADPPQPVDSQKPLALYARRHSLPPFHQS